MTRQAKLTRTFAALADPTRRAIVARLAEGNATLAELARPFRMSVPAVSKHLQTLERAGLVRRGQEAQRKPCRLVGAPLQEAAAWIQDYRAFWEGTFDRLENYLTHLKRKETRRDRHR